MAVSSGTPVPYPALVEQFHAAPPGKLYCLHGSTSVFRISLAVAAQVLLGGAPVTLIDGTNHFDAYYLADLARRWAARWSVTPDSLLEQIFVSRAFTCYQMEAVVTERLPAFMVRKSSPVAVIFGLLDTFYDEQAPLPEVRDGVRRIIATLRLLKSAKCSVLLASEDVRPASRERQQLFPQLAAAMDQLFSVQESERGPKILLHHPQGAVHGKNSTHLHDGHPAGNGKLVQVPPRVAQGGSRGA